MNERRASVNIFDNKEQFDIFKTNFYTDSSVIQNVFNI